MSSKARRKYGNRFIDVDGHVFHSQREGSRYMELKLLELSGRIADLRLQPVFELIPAFQDAHGRRHRRATYIADFMYTDCETGKTVVEDVKGVKTAAFSIKWKLAQYVYCAEGYIWKIV